MKEHSGDLGILDIQNNYNEVYHQTNVESVIWSNISDVIYTYGNSNKSQITKVSLADFSHTFVTATVDLNRIELTSADELIIQPKAWGPLYKLCCIADQGFDINDAEILIDHEWIYNWNVNDELVSILKFTENGQQINFYSTADSQIKDRTIALPEGKHVYHYSFNPKTQSVYYSSMKIEHYSLLKLESIPD